MGKFETNPFDRSALTDVRLLAGRSNEFRQIRFLLRNAFKQESRIKSIMITGDRGVGKTSFLNLIENECSTNNIIPIRLNLTESNSVNTNEFFWYLFSQTINTFLTLDLLGGRKGDIKDAIQRIIVSDGLDDVANWVFKTPILHKSYLTNKTSNFQFDLLVEDLKLLRSEIGRSKSDKYDNRTKILFLVDEAQNIYSNTKIIEEIRFVIQNQQLGYGFVFAGDNTYESSQWDEVFGGTHREFEIINLNYFDDIDSIKEYFRKSLESIDWTTKDIEEDLFYRFNLACSQIFELTSGKPAWINEIAQKMFERCMKRESDILRFDRNAQNDVKNILLASKQIDSVKLELIDNFPVKYKKWISKIFASELSTFNQVYFYSKFIHTGEDSLTLVEYQKFCEFLIEKGILSILEWNESSKRIGFIQGKVSVDFLDKRFVAFAKESDSIKLWLQVNSDGRYSFGRQTPDISYVEYINKEIASESRNTFILGFEFTGYEHYGDIRLSHILTKINKNEYNAAEAPYGLIHSTYRLVKRLLNSKCREILYLQLEDKISKKVKTWNVYNFNEHDRIVGFDNNLRTIQKLVSTVSSFNSSEKEFELSISIDKVDEPSMERFQSLIIKSGDSRKRGIVIEDKVSDLIKFYIDDHNVDNSYKVACFIFDLFEEGYDLSVRQLNNTGYVFLAKDELEKARTLLREAIKKIRNEPVEKDEFDTSALALYNYAMVDVKELDYEKAKASFQAVLNFLDQYPNDDSVGALFTIEFSDGKIQIKEFTRDDDNETLTVRKHTIKNLEALEAYFNIKKLEVVTSTKD